MKRPLLGAAALATTGVLTALSIAPGYAAHTVSQADATALRLAIAGDGADSGTVSATNDGSGEVKTGNVQPPIGVLGGQDLLALGVLAQDATAQIQGEDGYSAACAGVAGDGGSVAAIGDSNCITPGESAAINVANLDLSDTVVIDPDSALGALSDPVQTLLDPVIDPVTSELSNSLEPISELNLGGSLGAIEARCEALPGTASGDTTLTEVELSLTLPGQDPIVLATLPTNPAPNTKVVTDLDAVVAMMLAAVEEDLRTSLTGALGPVADVVDEAGITDILVDEVLAQIAPQLAPLEDLLDITLNKQSSTGPGHISVTALDLRVLKAAADQLGAPLVSAEIANVNCGPNSRIHNVQRESPGKAKNPEVPTVVNSGLDDGGAASSGDQGADSALLAGGLLALAGAAGALGYRRFAAK